MEVKELAERHARKNGDISGVSLTNWSGRLAQTIHDRTEWADLWCQVFGPVVSSLFSLFNSALHVSNLQQLGLVASKKKQPAELSRS